MPNGKVFINPKTGYLSNREKALPPPAAKGPVLTVRNPTYGSSSGSRSTPSPPLNKGKGKAIAPSISAASSRSNYSHLSYLSVGSEKPRKAKPLAIASSSKAGVSGSSFAGPSKGKAPVRNPVPSKAEVPAPFPSYDAGKVKASTPSPCYLTGIGRPKELRTFPGPARVGPASGADFCTPAGAPQIGLTWMLTKKVAPTANRRPLPLVNPPRVHSARAQRSFPARTPSSDRSSSRASNAPPDPAKSSISSLWLSGSPSNGSAASVGRTSSFFSILAITIEDEFGPVDFDSEMFACGQYEYDDDDDDDQEIEEEDAERILTVRNHNEGELRARHWRTSTFAHLRWTCSSTDTSHSTHSASSTASSRPSSLRVRTMRARTLDKLEGRTPGAPIPNPVASPIFVPVPSPAPHPSPPPGPSKFRQFVDRQKVNMRTVKNKVKWKLQGRTVVWPVARDGPSNFEID
ncbi:hypothetical protein BGZ68_003587 [Mortierella alpina]|nr:hypothetical protein BGZ68_003587 [Mortierella alpina]